MLLIKCCGGDNRRLLVHLFISIPIREIAMQGWWKVVGLIIQLNRFIKSIGCMNTLKLHPLVLESFQLR